jgi:rhodanese-related sulfurtransferase
MAPLSAAAVICLRGGAIPPSQKARSAMTSTNGAPGIRTISRDDLKTMVDRNAKLMLIDVLDAEQFGQFHLPGAINIPLDDRFETAITAAVPNKNDKIVVYSSDKSSDTSTRAAEKLNALGYTRVRDFKEGKQAWQQAAIDPAPGNAAPGSAAPCSATASET